MVRCAAPIVAVFHSACIADGTCVLQVSFHQSAQRLAVGCAAGTVVVYDLKTASRWHQLVGHKGMVRSRACRSGCPTLFVSQVSAVAFGVGGKLLVSVSLHDRTLRVWNATSSFFNVRPNRLV